MIFELNNSADIRAVRSMAAGRTIGLTSGVFDLFHHLHLVYLQKCRRLCDFLIVGVDADDLVQELKDKRPVIPEHQRLQIIDSIKGVDAAFTLVKSEKLTDAVKMLRVNFLFRNQLDFDGQPVYGSEHAQLVVVRDVELADSTSAIINKILRTGVTGI